MRFQFTISGILKCIAIVCVALSGYRYVSWTFLIGCVIAGFICGILTAIKKEPVFVAENIGLKCIYSGLITSTSAMAIMIWLVIPVAYLSGSSEITGKVIDVVFVAGLASGVLFPEARHWSRKLHAIFAFLPF